MTKIQLGQGGDSITEVHGFFVRSGSYILLCIPPFVNPIRTHSTNSRSKYSFNAREPIFIRTGIYERYIFDISRDGSGMGVEIPFHFGKKGEERGLREREMV